MEKKQYKTIVATVHEHTGKQVADLGTVSKKGEENVKAMASTRARVGTKVGMRANGNSFFGLTSGFEWSRLLRVLTGSSLSQSPACLSSDSAIRSSVSGWVRNRAGI